MAFVCNTQDRQPAPRVYHGHTHPRADRVQLLPHPLQSLAPPLLPLGVSQSPPLCGAVLYCQGWANQGCCCCGIIGHTDPMPLLDLLPFCFWLLIHARMRPALQGPSCQSWASQAWYCCGFIHLTDPVSFQLLAAASGCSFISLHSFNGLPPISPLASSSPIAQTRFLILNPPSTLVTSRTFSPRWSPKHW